MRYQLNSEGMKLKAPAAVAATVLSPLNWFLGICLAAFLTTISASVAAPQTDTGGLNPSEQWIVAQVTAGKIADLSKKFPEEKDRKLSVTFVQDLLTGNLTGVNLHRMGVRIKGAIIEKEIDMSNAQIPWEVSLDDCQFSSAAIFVRANFAATVSFENSTFKADANFNAMKVGQTASFNNAVFKGWVDFGSADIAGDFYATEAEFMDKVKGARFESMKVGGLAFFRDAKIDGWWVNFLLADFARNLEAQGVKFTNSEGRVDFYNMKVGQIANFNDAVFEGSVDFSWADIAGNFEAKRAQFKSAVVLMMNCGGKGDFTGAKFSGSAYFAKSTFLDLVMGDTRIRDLDARSLRAERSAVFTDLVVEHSADLSNADFATLDLSRSVWPKNRKDGGVFHMQGMSYKYICAVPGNEPESHKALLKLADQSAYTNDVYSNLEEFFLRQGYHGDADEAFIAKKRREREEYFRSRQWPRWLGSWMLNLLVAYGRRPWQAGIPCAILVALGCILFSPKKMELQKPENTLRVYSRFWYSLGLFLPFVDLQADKVWKPKADQTFLRNYMRVHIILGWILIPIVLAALTGLIK
jgi:uncharacterized protein YjbI with pentapeptide repeats